ncbi:sialate O-acetylesterase [Dyadobacter sp. CY343]|uniref:sialate O-acetylesterase n=1 Tax=Dyadobacter sp. CY343 TaxID=2907299 RepID=UPI001F2B3037|nr:sialate O-acetylesterase [Dyadobacter sp. CY343]MCE7059403.1 sialate O-acetylesterase [Dyadobacter sp. CY343]
MMIRIVKYIIVLLLSIGYTSAQNSAVSELKLAPVFLDHMVLQRNKPIKIFGKAANGVQVQVSFQDKTLAAKSDESGKWQVIFPVSQAGGPYAVTVSANNQKIKLTDVMIGDVWLCSGQSNMDFPLRASKTGPDELKAGACDARIRVLHRAGIVSTYNVAWDSVTLTKINRNEYFTGQWEALSVQSAASFSAVGYYFGKKIAADQNVPVGLIQVAVGGSPTESWVDAKRLEQEPDLTEIVKDYTHSKYVMEWCRERIGQNLVNATDSKQLHPFQPGYNFQAGILPLTELPIAGVIWYQGESNAHNVDGHARIFETLVSDWRRKWGYPFPFYYVQLSSIERPNWPEFRDSQRKLLNKMPNSGMAVSLDLGDSLDVHPTQKKEVGERLALLALRDTYKKNVVAEGPVAEKAIFKHGEIRIRFSNGKGVFPKQKSLLTKNNARLTGFELLTENGKRMSVNARISGNEVVIGVLAGARISTVLYAYQPFTRANLYNEAGLPASTFSIAVK